MCCGFGLRFFGGLALAIGLLLGILQLRLSQKEFIFDHKELADITKDALKRTKGQSVNVTLAFVEARLREEYGSHILPKKHNRWIFVNCGGWMGAMYLLHASLTEYVLFFGTGIDTSGHSGRYWAVISDTVVSGTMRQWKEGGMNINEYKVGDTLYHQVGEVTGVQWTSGTIMVEYGRGLIPSTLVFALADTLFGTTDFYILADTLYIYMIALAQELAQGNF